MADVKLFAVGLPGSRDRFHVQFQLLNLIFKPNDIGVSDIKDLADVAADLVFLFTRFVDPVDSFFLAGQVGTAVEQVVVHAQLDQRDAALPLDGAAIVAGFGAGMQVKTGSEQAAGAFLFRSGRPDLFHGGDEFGIAAEGPLQGG